MVENHQVFAEVTTRRFLADHQVQVVPTIAAARAQLEKSSLEAVLVDFDLDDGKGDELVRVSPARHLWLLRQ